MLTGLLHINLHIHDCIVILSLCAAVYMYTGHVFVGYVHFTHVCVPPDAQPSRLISGQSGCPACGPAVQLDERQLCNPVSKLERSVHCPLHEGVESVISVTNQAEREGQTNTSVAVLPGSGPVI